MTENEIISALEVFLKAIRISGEQYIDISAETLAGTLNLIYNLKAERNALIAGQESLQKALAAKITDYEALKADEEREHQYCKNVCEPKYKAEIERFKKIETAVNDLWGEIQKLATFKNKRKPTLEELLEYMENLKDEAIKEYVNRLKEQKYQSSGWSHGEHPFVVEESDIDDVLFEMVGEG